jgi:pimeloyl-ACP methyl ester carboxylesterase
MQPRLKQKIRFISKCLFVLLVVLILAGITYEQIGERLDRKRFPQVGRSVDIGGRSLNIYCSGEGGPAVILDTGGSAPGYENLLLQKKIAQFTSACWFDRAGLGWSDPSPVEQTSAAIADDLHALLHAAGVSPPYVLVGASFSGFNVRVFAGKYPAEVAGAVLEDAAHEDQYRYEPRAIQAPADRLPPAIRSLLCAALPLAARIGMVRFLLQRTAPPLRASPAGFTAGQTAIRRGLELQTKSFLVGASCNVLQKTLAQVRAAGNFGDRPLIVLTAGKPITFGDPEVDKELIAFHDIWVHQLQPQLAHLSTRGRQVILENSSHGFWSAASDLEPPGSEPPAVAAIREVVLEIRGN